MLKKTSMLQKKKLSTGAFGKSDKVATIEGETQASYLARFYFLSREDVMRIRKAYALSEVGHKNQVRDSGEPYFKHPRAVSLFLHELDITNVDLHIAALCHDLVEDTVITLEQIRAHFGDKVMNIVKTVSIPGKSNGSFVPQANYEGYFNQLRAGTPEAKLVALLDNFHNLEQLRFCSFEKKKRILERTEEFYKPALDEVAKHIPEAKKVKSWYKKALAGKSAGKK